MDAENAYLKILSGESFTYYRNYIDLPHYIHHVLYDDEQETIERKEQILDIHIGNEIDEKNVAFTIGYQLDPNTFKWYHNNLINFNLHIQRIINEGTLQEIIDEYDLFNAYRFWINPANKIILKHYLAKLEQRNTDYEISNWIYAMIIYVKFEEAKQCNTLADTIRSVLKYAKTNSKESTIRTRYDKMLKKAKDIKGLVNEFNNHPQISLVRSIIESNENEEMLIKFDAFLTKFGDKPLV